MENFRVTFESRENRKLTFDYIPVMGIPVNISYIADMIESCFKLFTTDKDFSHIIYANIRVPMKQEFMRVFDKNDPNYISTKSEDIMVNYLTTKSEYKDDFIKTYLQLMHDIDYYVFTTIFEEGQIAF